MDAIRRTCDHVDDFVGRSTFGRIFRLEGCGHVSSNICWSKSYANLFPSAGEGNQEYKISERNTRWSHYLLYNVST
jgi:hypothetical protein